MCAHTHTHSRPASLLLSLQPPLMEGLRGICTAAPARPETPARGTAGLCTARACLVGGDPGACVSSQPLGSEPQSEHPGPGLSRPPLFPPCVHTSGRCLLRLCPGQWGLSPAPPSPLFEVWVMQSVTGCRALPSRAGHRAWGPRPGAHAAALGVEGDQGGRASGSGVSTRAEGVESHFPGAGGPGVTGGLAGPGEPPVPTRERQRTGGLRPWGLCPSISAPGQPATRPHASCGRAHSVFHERRHARSLE